jgi:Na+-transporting NADH:ubiquinone oxidoreductase subunit F
MDFRAGSYLHVECPPYRRRFADFDIEEKYRADWTRHALWDLESESKGTVTRAYSLANAPAEKGMVILNVRISTPPAGSRGIPPGVVSSYLFGLRPGDEVALIGPFGDFLAEESQAEMVFVGGGAGMAPMRSHILDQLERIGGGRKISFWYGARSVREAFYTDLFSRLAADLYANHLRDHRAPEDIEYYLCGPPVMIAACRKMLDDLGVAPENIRFDDFGS